MGLGRTVTAVCTKLPFTERRTNDDFVPAPAVAAAYLTDLNERPLSGTSFGALNG